MKETVTCWIQRRPTNGLRYFALPTKLLKDFPPWQTVYDQFSKWNKRGVWEAAEKHLALKRSWAMRDIGGIP
jgi:hypothetical protein